MRQKNRVDTKHYKRGSYSIISYAPLYNYNITACRIIILGAVNKHARSNIDAIHILINTNSSMSKGSNFIIFISGEEYTANELRMLKSYMNGVVNLE